MVLPKIGEFEVNEIAHELVVFHGLAEGSGKFLVS